MSAAALPAGPSPARLVAASPVRSLVPALAAQEARRLMLHPLTLLGFGFYLVATVTTGLQDQGSRSAFETTSMVMTFYPGVLLILVGNLLATRDHRAGSEDMLDPAPGRREERVLALGLASLAPAVVGLLFQLAWHGYSLVVDRYADAPDAVPGLWHLLSGPVTLTGACLFGLILGVWSRARLAALVGVIALVAANVWVDAREDLRLLGAGARLGAMGGRLHAVGGRHPRLAGLAPRLPGRPVRAGVQRSLGPGGRPPHPGRRARAAQPGRRGGYRVAADAGRCPVNRLPPRSLVGASWWLVGRPSLLLPVAAAGLLTAVSLALMEVDYQAFRLMHGVGLILACAWVAAVDDPAGEVAAASPYSRAKRTNTRLLAAAAVVVPAWVGCAVAVELVVPATPVLDLGIEALALAALGLALGAGLRAWRDIHLPAHFAAFGLLALALLANLLPGAYVLIQAQTWGPPWEASLVRWAALGMVGVGMLGLALRDPLAVRRAH